MIENKQKSAINKEDYKKYSRLTASKYNFHLFSVTTTFVYSKIYFLYEENKKYISNSKSVYKEDYMDVTHE